MQRPPQKKMSSNGTENPDNDKKTEKPLENSDESGKGGGWQRTKHPPKTKKTATLRSLAMAQSLSHRFSQWVCIACGKATTATITTLDKDVESICDCGLATSESLRKTEKFMESPFPPLELGGKQSYCVSSCMHDLMGLCVMSFSNGSLMVVNNKLKTRNLISASGNPKRISSMTCLPNTTLLATFSESGIISIWDLEAANLIRFLDTPQRRLVKSGVVIFDPIRRSPSGTTQKGIQTNIPDFQSPKNSNGDPLLLSSPPFPPRFMSPPPFQVSLTLPPSLDPIRPPSPPLSPRHPPSLSSSLSPRSLPQSPSSPSTSCNSRSPSPPRSPGSPLPNSPPPTRKLTSQKRTIPSRMSTALDPITPQPSPARNLMNSKHSGSVTSLSSLKTQKTRMKGKSRKSGVPPQLLRRPSAMGVSIDTDSVHQNDIASYTFWLSDVDGNVGIWKLFDEDPLSVISINSPVFCMEYLAPYHQV